MKTAMQQLLEQMREERSNLPLPIEWDRAYQAIEMVIETTYISLEKEQMIEAFINSQDPLLENNCFHKALRSHPHLFQNKKGAWMKPIDDIVDSWWILKTVKAQISKS